ncbi:MAG: hypothetical protein ACLQU2_22035 [Candidatus Binataceae bacterium]
MTCQRRLLIIVFLAWIIAVPVAAIAGPHKGVVGPMEPATPVIVSGKLLTYEGQPAASQRIHFENAVSGDLFLAKTGPDGSFAFALPPGGYELRVEQGPIVVDFIDAQGEAVSLGTVSEPPKIQYWLQAEGLAAALIQSPAPITSNVQANNPYFPTGQIPPEVLPRQSATAPAAVPIPAVPE